MGKIIAVTNQKGGVGKTTTAINLSSCLSVLEKKTLLIDADPQANTTHGLGIDTSRINKSLFDLLQNPTNISECIITTENNENLDIIPTKISLARFETQPNTKFNLFRLQKALDQVKGNYDYIIVDCSPSLGLLLLNVLCAADSILIPLQCEHFAFEGLQKIFKTFKTVRNNYNSKLDIEGILITMYNPNQKNDANIRSQVINYFNDIVLNTIIYRDVKLSEAPSHGKSIYDYNSNSKGAINYLNLGNEIILRNHNQVDNKKGKLGKSLSDILKEDNIEDIDFIVNFKSSPNNDEKTNSKDDGFIGLTKEEVKKKLGLTYNDMYSDVWMFRISQKFSFLKKNYLYIYFENSKVFYTELKLLKQNSEKNEILLNKYKNQKING